VDRFSGVIVHFLVAAMLLVCGPVLVLAFLLLIGLPLVLAGVPQWVVLPLLVIPVGFAAAGTYVAVTGRVESGPSLVWAYVSLAGTVWALAANYSAAEFDSPGIPFLPSLPEVLLFSAWSAVGPTSLGLAFGTAIADWRKIQPLAVTAVLGFVVLGALVSSVSNQLVLLPSRHSDDAMIAHFREHEGEFRELAAMVEDDVAAGRMITRPRPWLRDGADWADLANQPGLGEERRQQYARLFRQTGLGAETRNRANETRLTFRYWVNGATAKGYVHTAEPVEARVDSLDRISVTSLRRFEPLYRQIAPDWYLYYLNVDWD
jgi:hypothetical protein